MAQIVNASGKKIFLNRYHIFGREPLIASTLLTNKICSKLHAAIFYENKKWYIEDRSTNGIVINNSLIQRKKIALESVKTIRFCLTEREEWTIEDLSPPASYLQNFFNQSAVELKADLPVTFNNTAFTLVKKELWLLENSEAVVPLQMGDIVYYESVKHAFILNEELESAVVLDDYSPDFELTFQLSENYETVDVHIDLDGLKTELLNKSYNFLWYLLAKKVQHDDRLNLDPEAIGWIDNLTLLSLLNKECKEDFDMYYLNLQIHRIRKQLVKLDNNYDFFFNELIQRKKGQIRMNTKRIRINEPTYNLYGQSA